MRYRAALFFIAAPLFATPAHAETRVENLEEPPKDGPKPVAKRVDPYEVKSGYMQFFATAMGGVGFRFNNPYRLSTPLGNDAESVSRTSSYVDLGIASTLLGHPLGFQHGISLRMSVALEGVSQLVVTPSYLLWRRKGAWAGYGRAGFGIVTAPDLTWGLEAAGGAAWFFLGGVGLVAEIVGNVFYGVGTTDVATAAYPVLSGQLGLIGSYEVLP